MFIFIYSYIYVIPVNIRRIVLYSKHSYSNKSSLKYFVG